MKRQFPGFLLLVVRYLLRRPVRRRIAHRYGLVALRCQGHIEPGLVPLHDPGVSDRQAGLGVSDVAIVDDPHFHARDAVQGRRTAAVLVPHLVGEVHELPRRRLWVRRYRDPARQRCSSRVGVFVVMFPADRRHPGDVCLVIAVDVELPGDVDHPVAAIALCPDVHPDPPAVVGRLLGQPQVVGGRFALPDLQLLVRHLHRPSPGEDLGITNQSLTGGYRVARPIAERHREGLPSLLLSVLPRIDADLSRRHPGRELQISQLGPVVRTRRRRIGRAPRFVLHCHWLGAGIGRHCRVGGGAPRGRWPPSAAQTVRAVFPHTAFTKTSSRDEDRWRNQRVDPPPTRRVQPVGKSPRSLMFGFFTHGTVHLSALAHLTVLSGPDRLRRPPSPTHSVAAP